MRKLATHFDPLVAELLTARLQGAGIKATSTVDATWRGGFARGTATVWVDDAAGANADSIYELFEQERAAKRSSDHCAQCGYDLRGHRETGECPECGRAYRRPSEDVPCPSCGEAVPCDFDLCWNCGVELRAEPEQAG